MASSNDLVAKADAAFDVWMEKKTLKSGVFLLDGAAPLEANKATRKLMYREFISKFDTMQYFCVEGSVKHPSIFLFIIIHVFTMMNSGFKERIFFYICMAWKATR